MTFTISNIKNNAVSKNIMQMHGVFYFNFCHNKNYYNEFYGLTMEKRGKHEFSWTIGITRCSRYEAIGKIFSK